MIANDPSEKSAKDTKIPSGERSRFSIANTLTASQHFHERLNGDGTVDLL